MSWSIYNTYVMWNASIPKELERSDELMYLYRFVGRYNEAAEMDFTIIHQPIRREICGTVVYEVSLCFTMFCADAAIAQETAEEIVLQMNDAPNENRFVLTSIKALQEQQ